MPVLPRTWSPGDLVSPTYLNGDLYNASNDSALTPTGVLFHARKPLYLAAAASAVSVSPGVFAGAFAGQGTASVIQDTPGDYSSHLDPAQWGSVQSVLAAADGSAADAGGGWFLMFSTTPVAISSANNNAFSNDIAVNGANIASGQVCLAGSGQAGGPWTLDLLNTAPVGGTVQVYTPNVLSGDSHTAQTHASPAGTGNCVRFGAVWASTAGSTLPSLFPPAPKTVWSAGDDWTAAWADGPAGVAGALEYLNLPPCLRADTGAGTTSCTNATATVIAVNTVQLDKWSAFNTSTHTWTCPADGLYLCYGLIVWTAAVSRYQASIRVNGTDYWGPGNFGGSGAAGTAAKVQVFSLLAGDTVQLVGYQTSGGTLATASNSKSRLVVAWVSSPGVPGAINRNPYFSQGTGGWAGNGGTISSASPLPALCPYPQALFLQPSGTAQTVTADDSVTPFSVTAGDWYGMSAWVDTAGTSQVLTGFSWLNAGGSVLSTSSATQTAGAAWTLAHTIQQAPGSAVSAYPRAGRHNAGTVPGGDTTYIAGVQAGQAGSGNPVPPNLAYRYTAGTPGGSVPPVFSSNLGNDLTFLTQKPYLLAFQNATQAGLSTSAPTQVNMQAVSGQVHSDYGDNYGGWNAGSFWYVAPVSGWYLVVAEVLAAVNVSASFPMVTAQLQISTGSSPDSYESHIVTSTADGTIPGAAAVGLYYLRAGDHVYPLISLINYPAPPSTTVSAGHTSHLECVWMSE